jgi:hypothetical protein
MPIDYILSSWRPFQQSEAYAKLQYDAMGSWLNLGAKVVLFNHPNEVDYVHSRLSVVAPKSSPPTIFSMLEWGNENSGQDSVIAIVNSDIVLSPEINLVTEAVEERSMTRSWAATSFRYSFLPKKGIDSAWRDPSDQGLDIFIAPYRIWKMVHAEMKDLGAEGLTLGRHLWDNVLNAYFRARLPTQRYINLTPWKVVFHPEHGERGRHDPYSKRTINAVQFLSHGGIPPTTYPIPTKVGTSHIPT